MKNILIASSLWLLNFLMPGRNRRLDVAYGSAPAAKYDEYPTNDPNTPIVLFWHGGSWVNGHKNYYRFMGNFFQSMGFRVIVVGYPLYPEQTFPGFINDAQQAVNKVRQQFPDAPIFTSGHSAGAHTAVITAMKSWQVSGCIAISTPCHISKKYWEHIFGDAFKDRLQDPRNYIEGSSKKNRYLLIHGKYDPTVSYRDSQSLNEKLINYGAKSQLLLLASDHVMILWRIAFSGKIKNQIKEFIKSD